MKLEWRYNKGCPISSFSSVLECDVDAISQALSIQLNAFKYNNGEWHKTNHISFAYIVYIWILLGKLCV